MKINVVIPLKNRGKHIALLLNNIQNIVKQTNEMNVKVWIGDFHSTDINLSEFITQFSYPIEIVLFKGVFRIALALQKTAEKVTNANEIFYFCDADSVFPNCIFERIRKLVKQGESCYIPCVSRQQHNGRLLTAMYGGTGNVGVYVEDFVKANGWNDWTINRVAYGKHDTHIHRRLVAIGLKVHRPLEKDQWIRSHRKHLGWGR